MLLRDSEVRFSSDELASLFGLPRTAVEALFRNAGAPGARSVRIRAADVEVALNGWLVRLYHAVDHRSHEGERPRSRDEETAAPPPDARRVSGATDLEITHSLAEFEQGRTSQRANLRLVPRYVPRRPLRGTYRQTSFSVLQMSATGVRIRHDETLRAGDEAKVTLALEAPARPIVFRARVVWTSIAQRGDGPSFCISGLRATANEAELRLAVASLAQRGDLSAETAPSGKSSARSGDVLDGLSDDDVASIIRATRLFTSDPNAAERWIARARTGSQHQDPRLSDDSDRAEILGICEYLDRRIDPDVIEGVVQWIRRTRSAGAVPEQPPGRESELQTSA